MDRNGYFGKEAGEYVLNKIPEAGLYEYIYKNDDILLKVDQYGIQMCQIEPPVGVALVKREKREISSPVKVFISSGDKVMDNFAVHIAKEISIDYKPAKAVYSLDFVGLKTKTELFVPANGKRFVMTLTIENVDDESKEIKIMPCVYPYVNELLMAPWDKPEWYTKTNYLQDEYPTFLTTRYSVQGKKEERRYFSMLTNLPLSSYELSEERLLTTTNNFSCIPDRVGEKTGEVVYAFGQCFAGVSKVKLEAKSKVSYVFVFAASMKEGNVANDISESKKYFECEHRNEAENEANKRFRELFSVNRVKTGNQNFDKFVNEFLPLELDWVSSLDRGWPTGMRGVRDASNDFEGYISYDKSKCRDVITNIFSKQRSDGWYPRQVPSDDSEKFDLRHFVDGACFFAEYVYDYLAMTDDWSILEEQYAYYDDKNKIETGYDHLRKGIEYLTKQENIGEHGLVKMQGGDWLDCLNGAGVKGRGESVMVSCQLVMSLGYLAEISKKLGKSPTKYIEFRDKLKIAINAASYNSDGFYNAVFTDNGVWILSNKDPDGEKRVYVPTNAYAIISKVAEGKEEKVISNIESLKTEDGYRLFSAPFGAKNIEGIGKMGTGDFQPFFAENASVYNHGSQLFYLRALAETGDYSKIYDVLNFAMPFDASKHPEERICAAPYAVTNCYHLVPSFYGRTGFSFLTGSVAMIQRAIYQWMFGVRHTLDTIDIKPCVPMEYSNAEISMESFGKNIHLKYFGYGNKIKKATINGKPFSASGNVLRIAKKDIESLKEIDIEIALIG